VPDDDYKRTDWNGCDSVGHCGHHLLHWRDHACATEEGEKMSEEYQEFKQIHDNASRLLDRVENGLNTLNEVIARMDKQRLKVSHND
jgi:hypothetical protein